MTKLVEPDKSHKEKELEQIKFFLEDIDKNIENTFSKKQLLSDSSHRISNLEQRDMLLEGTFNVVEKELASVVDTFDIMKRSIKSYKELYSDAELKYKDLYENSPDLYRTINTNGIITNCNETYTKTLGFTKDEVIGTSIFDYTPQEHMDKKRESFEKWKRTGIVGDEQMWMMRKDGTTFPALINITTIFDKDSEILGCNSVIRDITEIFEAKEKIKEDKMMIQSQLKELQKLSKAKDEFLTMITHELKTPIVPIKTYVDMMISEEFGSITEVQKQKLQFVKNSTGLILDLVSDLLDSQKLEQDNLKLDKKRYSLFKIVSDAIEKLKPIADSRGITIVTDLQDSTPCLCDKERIEQVMHNLLLNSIEFSPKDTGKIQINLQQQNDVMKVIVRDNGVGIVKENLEKIFQKFYQIDSSITRELVYLFVKE